MKKTVCVLFMTLLFLFSACGTGGSPAVPPAVPPTSPPAGEGSTDVILPPKTINFEKESPYIYDVPSGILVQYDLEGRRAEIACPEPFCSHGKDCPVTGITSLAVAVDFLYFIKGMGDIYCYDLVKNKVVPVFTATTVAPLLTPAGRYLYFSASSRGKDETGDTARQSWHFYRYNAETNATERLTDTPLAVCPTISGVKNERLYFSENGTVYSTNLRYQDRKEGKDYGSAEEYSIAVENRIGGMAFIKIDKKTGAARVIAEGMDSLRSVYLGDPVDLDRGYRCYGWLYMTKEIKGSDIPRKKLVYIDAEDFSSRILWEEEAPIYLTSAWQEGHNSLCSGGYTGIRVQKKEGDTVTSGLLVVNPHKNEVFTILCEETEKAVSYAGGAK